MFVWLRHRSFCVLVCVGAPGPLTCTLAETITNFPPVLVKSWKVPEGLPQNSVQAIAQTPEGYLWVGTKGGLARFDGVRFSSYGLADGLRSLDVADLLEDGAGGLWIGTFGGGLSHWRAGSITTVTTEDGLAHNNALVLAAGTPGTVWVGGSGGLQHWGTNGATHVGAAEGLPAGEIAALASDRAQGLWIAVVREGLFHLRGGRCERIEGPSGQKRLEGHALLVDDSGALWFSIGNGKVLRRHGGTWTEFNPSHGLPKSFIYCLARGASGEVWAGTHAQGLYVFREGKFHAVTAPGELERNIRSIYRGRDGLMWVGTQSGGLNRLAPRRVLATLVEPRERRTQVHGLAEGPDGRFWVTTYGGGLYQGDLASWTRLEGAKSLNEAPFLLTALRTSRGAVYFGGVKRLHWLEPGATNLMFLEDAADVITALCEAPDGSLWFGTRSGELRRLAGGVALAPTNAVFAGPVSGLAGEPGGAVWVATRGAGLFRWADGTRRQWTTAEGLPTDVLRALHRDREGTLWMGTVGGGLAWMREGRLHSVNSRHGLGDDVISQILEDDDGNLWLGGNRGIMRVSKRELSDVAAGRAAQVHPLALSEADGIPESECTGGYSPAGCRSQSGLLCFSTVYGVVAVNPKHFGPFGALPPVVIEEAWLDGRRLENGRGEIELTPGPRELEIRYTAFNYAKPERIRFRHRLAGADQPWTEVGGARSARFPWLPPGRYRFEVVASNEDAHWSEPPASLGFSVPPFYWQTGWFRAVLAGLFMAGGAGMVWRVARVRIRQACARERLARAEAEAQQRYNEVAHLTRVATLGELSAALAHELNQPLTAILSNAQAAQRFLAQDPPDPAEIRDILQDIVADDQRASEVIRRLRTLLKKGEFQPRPLDVNELIQEVLKLMQRDLATRAVSVATQLENELPLARGDRVQLQQVLINLVLNAGEAMSHIAASERLLTLRSCRGQNGVIQISVADTGSGIRPGDEEKIFEPYHTTKAEGLGLGLSLSRSILLAHGGRLWAEQRAAGGATFHLIVPEGNGKSP